MGRLQAVAAAAKVAAAAAAAAVSAASRNRLSSPSPFRDEALPRCPRSPFCPSPPPPQGTARKTLNFRGGAARERARHAAPPREPPATQGACAARPRRPAPPRPALCFGGCCGADLPRPPRSAWNPQRSEFESARSPPPPLPLVGPRFWSGWGSAEHPLGPRLLCISGFCPSLGEAPALTAAHTSSVLGGLSVFE